MTEAVMPKGYELLTGERPFGSPIEYLPNVSRGEVPTTPSAHGDRIPAALDAAVLRMLAHDTADRYQSARDALGELPPCPAGRAELVAILRELRATVQTNDARDDTRGRWPWSLDMALMAALAAFALAAPMSRANSSSTPAQTAPTAAATALTTPAPAVEPQPADATEDETQPEVPAAEPATPTTAKPDAYTRNTRTRAPADDAQKWITLDEWIPHGQPLVEVTDARDEDAPSDGVTQP